MDSAAVIAANHIGVQNALALLSTLSLTSLYFPPQAYVQDGAKYDHVIVGGGSEGSLLAARLADADEDRKILLIEAGDDPPLEAILPGLASYVQNSKADWNMKSSHGSGLSIFNLNARSSHKSGIRPIGSKNQEFHLKTGKMLGGSDGTSFMLSGRGSKHDYDKIAEIIGDPSWKYENILPYFTKTESLQSEAVLNSPTGEYHGTEGEIKITKLNNNVTHKYFQAIEEMGYERVLDTDGIDRLGFTQPFVYVADNVRQSSSYSVLGSKKRQNLHVLKKSLVTKIFFDGKKATGVQVLFENNTSITVNSERDVIVSAGTFKTPQLLMLSGIGPKSHLELYNIPVIADLPVGDNLQDHLFVPLTHTGYKTNVDTSPKIGYGEFPLSLITGYVALEKTQKYPDYEAVTIIAPRDTKFLTEMCTSILNYIDPICNTVFAAGKGRELLFTLISLYSPESKGRVRLKSTNPRDDPLVYPKYYSEPKDMEKHKKYLSDFNRIKDTDYMKSIGGDFVDISGCSRRYKLYSNIFWECYMKTMMQTLWHYSSTCPMGSVVDSRLRVLGIDNLRIVDVSVLPNGLTGKQQSTGYMIAEKAADMILEDNKEGEGEEEEGHEEEGHEEEGHEEEGHEEEGHEEEGHEEEEEEKEEFTISS